MVCYTANLDPVVTFGCSCKESRGVCRGCFVKNNRCCVICAEHCKGAVTDTEKAARVEKLPVLSAARKRKRETVEQSVEIVLRAFKARRLREIKDEAANLVKAREKYLEETECKRLAETVRKWASDA